MYDVSKYLLFSLIRERTVYVMVIEEDTLVESLMRAQRLPDVGYSIALSVLLAGHIKF